MLDVLYSINAKRALFSLLVIVIVFLALTNILLIAFLIAASLFISFAVGKLRIKSIGIELVTFITILSALVYGPATGAVIGLALIIFHLVIPQYAGAYVIWVIPEYALVAFLAAALGGGIASVGITITLILNAINVLLTFIVYREHLPRYLPYAVTNVAFNIILFTQVGEAVLGMVK